MDHYVTGAVIKALREKRRMTQAELAEELCVSDKTVSNGRQEGDSPDVSLLEPLGKALHISVAELLCGQAVVNTNRASNMLKSRFYVCPVCGNVLFARGDAVISCCGIQLPALETEEQDPAHRLETQRAEDEIYVSAAHPMSKDHYLSFIAYMTPDSQRSKHCIRKAVQKHGSFTGAADGCIITATGTACSGSGWISGE